MQLLKTRMVDMVPLLSRTSTQNWKPDLLWATDGFNFRLSEAYHPNETFFSDHGMFVFNFESFPTSSTQGQSEKSYHKILNGSTDEIGANGHSPRKQRKWRDRKLTNSDQQSSVVNHSLCTKSNYAKKPKLTV